MHFWFKFVNIRRNYEFPLFDKENSMNSITLKSNKEIFIYKFKMTILYDIIYPFFRLHKYNL